MSNNDTQCVVFRSHNHYFESESSLNRVLSNSIEFDAGDVIYVPAYKQQYVDEIVTPAVPAKPVEPEIGLSWESRTKTHIYTIVDNIDNGEFIVYWRCNKQYGTMSMTVEELAIHAEHINYPTTPEVPAVTRTVRIWVKL